MYKTKLIAMVAVFLGLVFVATAFSQDHGMTYRRYSEDHGALSTPKTDTSFSASYLLGHRVWGGGSWELGTIENFVIDQTNGRVALVILSDVPGYGSRKVAIPFGFLTRDQGGVLKAVFPPETPVGFGADTSIGDVNMTGSDGRFPYSLALAPGQLQDEYDVAWVESVYRHYGYAPYWTDADSSMVLYGCDDQLMNADFRLSDSDAFVRVNDFVIDPDGHVSYVVLSDIRDRQDMVAVPFSLLRGDSPDACVFTITQDQLASAPSYNAASDFGNRMYVERIYRFYGVQPYWTEEVIINP
jgi:hypothetical protein